MARQLCTPHLELGAQFKFGIVVVVDVANVQTNSITQIKYSSNHQQQQQQRQQQQEQEKHKS